ncbi:MAG: DNA gyrase modulator, partial [Deltaproteobacteria bacterium]
MGVIQGFDPFKILKEALKNGGEFADIYVEDTANTSIVCEDNKIEKVISGRDLGAGIRVITAYKTFYAYTNELTEKALLEAAGIVAKGVRGSSPAADIGPVSRNTAKPLLLKTPPQAAPLSDKVELVTRAEKAAYAVDERIRQVRVVYGDGFRRIGVANSLGEWTEEEMTGLVFFVSAVSRQGDVVQTVNGQRTVEAHL